MNQNLVRFRYGTPVTTASPFTPPLLPGSFTFDSSNLALYIDTDNERVQVMDPLKLSLRGGTLTGDLDVMNDGTTTINLSAASGTITGQFLETVGNIAYTGTPALYAVIDEAGRIRSRTLQEMRDDVSSAVPVMFDVVPDVVNDVWETTCDYTGSELLDIVNSGRVIIAYASIHIANDPVIVALTSSGTLGLYATTTVTFSGMFAYHETYQVYVVVDGSSVHGYVQRIGVQSAGGIVSSDNYVQNITESVGYINAVGDPGSPASFSVSNENLTLTEGAPVVVSPEIAVRSISVSHTRLDSLEIDTSGQLNYIDLSPSDFID